MATPGPPVTAILSSLALAFSVQATAYSPCSSGTITASGQPVHAGVAAANWLPLGTRIRISPAAFGRTLYTILDRSGYGTSLDLWTSSCTAAWQYGRRVEHVTILGRQ
jgi:3D (Asp-Asp-Asp) domain-containing protein